MDRDIKVVVEDRVATATGDPVIICGNSDYTVTFSFDDEWEGIEVKTARFKFLTADGVQHIDLPFTGDVVEVPALADTREVEVGVYAGNLTTTTGAPIRCLPCIRCGSGEETEPNPDKYDELMDLIKGGIEGGGCATDEQIAAAVESYLTENPVDGLTTQQAKDLAANTAARHKHTTDHMEYFGVDNADDRLIYFHDRYPNINGKIPFMKDLEGFCKKSEVEGLISEQTHWRFELVEALPETGEANVIYLVPNDSEGSNVYDEYIFINGAFEIIGSTAIDLTDYAKTEDIPTKTSQLTNDSGFITAEDLPETPGIEVSEIPDPPKESGTYELNAYIKGNKKVYYWEAKENTREFFDYIPSEKGILSPNDMFNPEKLYELSGQDGAFYKDFLYRDSASGIVHIINYKNGQTIATYTHDKVNLLKPHANSVSIAEINGTPYMYSNIYNTYANAENKHIGECCVYKTYDYLAKISWVGGSLHSGTGELTAADNRQSTDFLNIAPISSINISNANFLVSCYDSNKVFLGQFSKDQSSVIKGSGQWLGDNAVADIKSLKSINNEIAYIRLCVNVGNTKTPNISITYDNEITDVLVQLIKIGFIDDAELWTVTDGRPYGNFIVDTENSFLYVCVLDNASNSLKWHKFKLPSITEGEYNSDYDCLVKTLEETDIIESWATSYAPYIQGCCYYDNKIWITHGSGKPDTTGAYLLIVDLNTKTVIAMANLLEANVTGEPELICFYNEECYYASADATYKFKFV